MHLLAAAAVMCSPDIIPIWLHHGGASSSVHIPTPAGDEAMDNLTMIGLPAQLTDSPRSRTYSSPVPYIPEAVGMVRHRAHTVLTAWEIPQSAVEETVLVISELVTNAIVHASPPAELRLSLGGIDGCAAIRVEVTDAGAAPASGWTDSFLGPGEHGRGSVIVHALAIRHGTRRGAGTVTWWADLPTE